MIAVPISIIYGIFFYPSIREKNIRDNYYISIYEVHYLDGIVDTAQVIGPFSNEREVDFSTSTNWHEGEGYVFCGINGIYRVRLLSFKKTQPKFNPIYFTSIKFKNNK